MQAASTGGFQSVHLVDGYWERVFARIRTLQLIQTFIALDPMVVVAIFAMPTNNARLSGYLTLTFLHSIVQGFQIDVYL